MKEDTTTLDNICFVISPIHREKTENHQKFREVLEFVIKPAVDEVGFGLKVLRADDIERAGSFIKDILEYISGAFVVIADLTEQNPNVFYELGVKHSLSPRTILIAQSLDDIPSDLREYRTIIYDVTAKGAATFKQRIDKYLREIKEEPQRLDNPVLDRLGIAVEKRTQELEGQVAQLESQLESVLKKGQPKKVEVPSGTGSVQTRLSRILKLKNIEYCYTNLYTVLGEGENTIKFIFPKGSGDFQLVRPPEGRELFYISLQSRIVNIEHELADIRVLMGECSGEHGYTVTFVIVSGDSTRDKLKQVRQAFNKMKTFLPQKERKSFKLDIWDNTELTKIEMALGIKVDIPE